MPLTPTIALHLTAALGAVVTGPVALWARRGREKRPRLHRAFGYAWVVLMVVTAVSALFIRERGLPNIAGYTPIHLLIPFTLYGLVGAFRALSRGDIRAHRRTMQSLYIGACLVAGALALLPGRFLGHLLWSNVAALPLPPVLESTMLYQLLVHHPEALGSIVARTPRWVWMLLAGLVAIGANQLRDRTASALRMALVPLGMTAFGAWGMASAFSRSAVFAEVLAVWAVVALSAAAALLPGKVAATYDAQRREFRLPGSVVPLLLVTGIFLVKWAVGVELAMAPERALDTGFALAIAALYGVFNGVFIGRSARLFKLALGPLLAQAGRSRLFTLRDPW